MYILSSAGIDQISDIIRNKYGYSPATYGIVNEKGNPNEIVLTGPDETCIDECLDYILIMNFYL